MPIPFQNIAGSIEQYDPMSSIMKLRQLQALSQEAKTREQEQQMNAMKLAEMGRLVAEREAVSKAYNDNMGRVQTQAVSPEMTLGGIAGVGGGRQFQPLPREVQGPLEVNREGLYSSLAQAGQGKLIPGMQSQEDAAAEAQRKAALEDEKTRAELQYKNAQTGELNHKLILDHIDQIGRAGKYLDGLDDVRAAAEYPAVVQSLVANKVIPSASSVPPQFDRQWVRQRVAESMTAKEQFEANQPKTTPAVEQQALTSWLTKNPGKTADDFLTWKARQSPMMMSNGLTLTPEATAMAAQLYAQTGQLPAGFARAPQVTANVINQAATGAPDIAANKLEFGAKKSTKTYFTSGAGGKQLTAFNTAITHLDTLDKLANDLNNTDIQIVNRAKQMWSQQTGNAAPANFAAAVNAMSGEVAAALKASGATDQEIAHVSSTFDRAQSPAQLKGAIGTYRELLKSKEQQLKKQYDAGMKGGAAFDGQGGGISVTDPRGVVHSFPTQQAADAFKQAAGIR